MEMLSVRGTRCERLIELMMTYSTVRYLGQHGPFVHHQSLSVWERVCVCVCVCPWCHQMLDRSQSSNMFFVMQTNQKSLKQTKWPQSSFSPMLALLSWTRPFPPPGPLRSASSASLPRGQFSILSASLLSPALGSKTLTSSVIEPRRTTKGDFPSLSRPVFQEPLSPLWWASAVYFIFLVSVTTAFKSCRNCFSLKLRIIFYLR